MPWWPLKSPHITEGLGLLIRYSMSSISQSPLGTYAEMKSVAELFLEGMLTPMASTVL